MRLCVLIVLLSILEMISAIEKCSSRKCCWIDIPDGYCGMALPTEGINIRNRFHIQDLEEVNESKMSYTIKLR